MVKKLKVLIILIFIIVAISNISYGQTNAEIISALESSIKSNLFFSFMSLKSLGAAFENNAYTKDEISKVISIVRKYLSEIEVSLQKLNNKSFVDDITKAIGLLRKMCDSLEKYASSNSINDLKTFESARDKAWEFISKLLS